MSQNAPGRQPIFTEADALRLLNFRKMFDASCTIDRFRAEMIRDNQLPRECAAGTLFRLLRGTMFPNLIDPETGKTFDYVGLPKACRGRPKREEDSLNEITGEPRPKFGKLRRQLIEVAGERARDVALAQIAILKQNLSAREHELEQRLNAKLQELWLQMHRPPPQFVPTNPLPGTIPNLPVWPDQPGDDPRAPTITCEGKASAAG